MTLPSLLPTPTSVTDLGGTLPLGTAVAIHAAELPGEADPVGILTQRLRATAGLSITSDADVPITFARRPLSRPHPVPASAARDIRPRPHAV